MIDIIVPVYNVEKYLEKCVQSVLDQKYTDYHIILIDDGSKDSSGEICNRLAENSDKISVIHKVNGGLSSARNVGLDASTGEYVLFLDSDDTLTEDALQILMNAMNLGDVDAVFGGYNVVDEAGKLLHTLTVPERVLLGDERFTVVYDYAYMVMAHGKLFRREVINTIRFREGRLHEDVFAYHELVYNTSKIYCVEEPLINYLQRADSIMGKKFSMKNFDALEALFERVCFFDEKKLQHCKDSTVEYIFKYLLYIIHQIDFKDNELSDKFLESYKKWKNLSGRSHDIEFNLVCSLYRCGILHRPLISYRLFKIAKKMRLLIRSKSVVSQLLLHWNFKRRYILMLTPMHGNLGDQAIAYSEIQFLQDCGVKNIVEIKAMDYLSYCSVIRKFIHKRDVIAIHGGGNIGSLWPVEAELINDIAKKYKSNLVFIFPETVYFSDDAEGHASYNSTKKAFEANRNLHIFLRDETSFWRMKEMLPEGNVYLCPDAVLYLGGRLNLKKCQRSGAYLCMRSDIEKTISNSDMNMILQILKEKGLDVKFGDTVIDYNVTKKTRKSELEKKWEQFSSSKIVITDRLHGMIFAAITNTPCIALKNSSGKVKAVYKWIEQNAFIRFAESPNELKRFLDEIDLDRDYHFDNTVIQDGFKPLAEFVNKL